MAIAMIMRWAGITTEQYDAVRRLVNWEGNPPTGGLYHVSWQENDGMHVADTWESADDFNRFVEQRLMPGVQQLGIPGQPEVQVHEVHAIFAPGYRPK